MDRFICWVCVFLAGVVIGVAAGIIGMLPKTRVDHNLVDRCRRQMAAIEAMPEADQARFWAQVHGNEMLREEWGIKAAIADIEIAR